jgi:Protein kinase domain/Domain of Unknown Function (DUF1080)
MPADVARIKELFLALLEKAGPERTAFLDSLSGGDTELRTRLEAMLRTHEASGELLARTPEELLADADATYAVGESADRSTEEGLSFLEPPTIPGDLGRLGHYRVNKVLGRGGFGIVFRAFDERLHRVVAIKALSPAYAAIGSARKRFIREARAAAAVKNEHVVGIYDVQENAEPPYLVMECIDGISLQDKLDKQGPLGLKEILRIGMQIAEGLAAAHKQGLVHCDIKPANILLENGVERVKITDFGLARAVDDASVTQSGTVAGTPMYMSPEQAEGLPIDHRSDLFSLGTVLYAMCTGQPPFRATGTHAVLKRVIEAAPRPIREINDEVPEWLAAILRKLHAKQPDDRFRTAAEVAELLGRHLADLQAGRATRAPIPQAKAPRWSFRRSRAGAMILSGAILFGAVAAWGVWQSEVHRTGLVELSWDDPKLMVEMRRRDGNEVVYSSGTTPGAAVSLPEGAYAVAVRKGDDLTHTEIVNVKRGERTTVVIPEWGEVQFPNIGEDFQLIVNGEIAKSQTVDGKRMYVQRLPKGDVVWLAKKQGKTMGSGGLNLRGGQTFTIPTSLIPPWQLEQQKRADATEPGWVPLFNGKDLSGWQEFDGPKASDGEIQLSFHNSAVDTVNELPRHFHLRMKVKLVTGQGTLRFHAQPRKHQFPQPDPKDGYFLVLSETAAGNIKGELHSKTPFGEVPNSSMDVDNVARCGEWFDLDIVADGNYAVVRIDGERRMIVPMTQSAGVLSLWNSDRRQSQIAFRNIQVKELPPEESAWVPLFNGKDLSGWQQQKQFIGNWNIVEGQLHCSKTDDAWLFSDRVFTNFELRAEFQVERGSAGVTLRASRPNVVSAVYGVGPPGYSVPLGESPNQWHTLVATCKGNRRIATIDGKQIQDAEDREYMYRAGQICLHVIGPDPLVRFKKIEIKELPATPYEKPLWDQLFNGMDTTGWIVPAPGAGKGDWEVNALEGVFVGRGPKRNYVFTERDDFQDFHLKTEVRCTGDADSALFFRCGKELLHDEFPAGYQVYTGFLQPHRFGTLLLTTPQKKAPVVLSNSSVDAAKATFHPLELIAQGNRMIVKVDGKVVTDYQDDQTTYRKGRIAIQIASSPTEAASGTVEFKKIEIKELPPRQANHPDAPARADPSTPTK